MVCDGFNNQESVTTIRSVTLTKLGHADVNVRTYAETLCRVPCVTGCMLCAVSCVQLCGECGNSFNIYIPSSMVYLVSIEQVLER